MNDKFKTYPLALITGSGHRLGREIAINLGKRGYAIGIHYNTSIDSAEETYELIKRLNIPVGIFKADLTQENQINEMFEKIKSFVHPLKVLVNSAGVMLRCDLLNMESSEWDLTMNLNLRAIWLCSRLAFHQMKIDGGTIINISDSGAGRIWTGYPAYSISKASVEVLTKLSAKTFAPTVRVNAISPGLIMPSDDLSPDTWKHLIEKLPMKRQGEPAHINDGINFLIQNDYITGQTIVIDGGYQLV